MPTDIEQLRAEMASLTPLVQEFAARAHTGHAELTARLNELEQKYVRLPTGHTVDSIAGRGRSLGTALAASDRFKQWREGGAVGKVMLNVNRQDLDLRSQVFSAPQPGVAANASVLVAPDFQREIIEMQMRPLRIRELLRPGRTGSNMIWYTQQILRELNAAPVTEGQLKPQSEVGFELKQATVEVIAHWVLASKQSLDDVDSLGAFLDNELRYGLAFAEEQQLLYGSGVSPNLFGIIPQAQPFAPAFTIEVQTQLDVILLAILQAELALFPVTGIVLHPTDFRKMQLIKSSINTYLGNGPWQSGQSTLWGCPVARSLSINEGDFLVGAFGLGAQVFDREDAQIFLSTEDSDNFRRNLVTCLAEERLTLTVPRPQAFVQGSLSGAVTG